MLRRDRHKVYATDLQQHEGGDGDAVASPTAFSQDGLSDRRSSGAPHLVSEGDYLDQDARESREGGYVGAGACDQNNRGEEAAILGSVGPGAEPPVAVAFHAFAHEKNCMEAVCNRSQSVIDQGTETVPLSLLCSDQDMVQGPSDETCESFSLRGDEKNVFGGKQDITDLRPMSTRTSNEGEADTLPDSFHLSDEYGPEGASTGRNQHDDDDGYMNKRGGPLFIGASTGTSCGRSRSQATSGETKSSSGWHSRKKNEHNSPSGFQGREDEKGGALFGSLSDNSDCWSSSSARSRCQPQPQSFRRRPRHSSRRPPKSVTKRNSRIAPSEDLVSPTELESEGGHRRRRLSCRGSAKNRSPSPRRSRGTVDSSNHRRVRRGVSGRRNRVGRRGELVQIESICGETKDELEAEVAQLRRENEELKRRQGRKKRPNDEGSKVELWRDRHSSDGCFAGGDSPQRVICRRDDTFHDAGRPQGLPREQHAPIAEQGVQHEQRRRSHSTARASNLSGMDTSAWRSSSRRRQGVSPWSDFVSKSNSSPGPIGPYARGSEPSENVNTGLDLSLPRVLVEGGFLWKVPCRNAGTPKRRWFQIKPAQGLLTTASGRLVVRPTSAGGIGAGAAVVGGKNIVTAVRRRTEDEVDRKESARSLPMMRLHAAWPLAFIWLDPERDLKRSPPREMRMEEVIDLARGHKTPAFWQQAAHRGIHTLPDPKLCFSLIGHDRTLDLAAESLPEARQWVLALARVALMADRRGSAAASGYAAVRSPRSQLEVAMTALHPDSGGISLSPRSEDTDGYDAGISQAHLQRRRSEEAGESFREEHDFCTRSEEKPVDEKAGVLEKGGAWSVDTVRAWRKRLFPAVTRGDVAGVLALYDQGCPVDLVQAGTGDTPMLLACRLGDVEMVAECLRRGSRNDPHPDFGQTALQAAVAAGREACARLLLETAAPSRSDVVVSNHKDPNKDTPLHVACRRGYRGIVEILLHHGSDLRTVDRKGNTPLHGAAGCGHAAVLAALLDAGGDAVLEEENARGERAMHTAAASGHIACVELLLGTAAEPDMPRADGQTPFALASYGSHLAVTRLIRQYAPAAGTPSGGNAQFQIHQRASVGKRSATADALPRPHASGPPSKSIGEPSRSGASPMSTGDGRLGCTRPISASTSSAPLPHGSLFDGLQVYVVGGRQPLGSQHATTAGRAGMVSTSSAYASTSARTMILESHRLSTSSQQHQQHQRCEQQGQQQRNLSAPTQQASHMVSSSASSFPTGLTLESNWKDNVLSAPLTIAPSPPISMSQNVGTLAAMPGTMAAAKALDADVNVSRAPGSARALARMIHFSNENQAATQNARTFGTMNVEGSTRDTLTLATGVVGDVVEPSGSSASASSTGEGGAGEAHVEPLGSWMTPRLHDEEKLNEFTRKRDFDDEIDDGALKKSGTPHRAAVNATMPDRLGEDNIAGDTAAETPATGRDIKAAEKTKEEVEDWFVVDICREEEAGRPGSGVPVRLPGLWHVLRSQGYPYFLHEATGHSQWEDPRERSDEILSRERLLSVEASVTAHTEEYCSVERPSEEQNIDNEEGLGEEANTFHAKQEGNEGGRGQQPLPPPGFAIQPIKPRKVPVAVNVSHLFDVAGVRRSSTIATRDPEGFPGANSVFATGSTPAPRLSENTKEHNQAEVEARNIPEASSDSVHVDDKTCRETCGSSLDVDSVDSNNFIESAESISFEGNACSWDSRSALGLHRVEESVLTEVDDRRANNINSNNTTTHGNGNNKTSHEDLVDGDEMHILSTKEGAPVENEDTGNKVRAQQPHEIKDSGDSLWPSLFADEVEGAADGVWNVNAGSPKAGPGVSESSFEGFYEGNGKRTGGQEGPKGQEEEEGWWQELHDETAGESNKSELSSRQREETSARDAVNA